MFPKVFKDAKEYARYFSNLIELEREAEKEFHIKEIQLLK